MFAIVNLQLAPSPSVSIADSSLAREPRVGALFLAAESVKLLRFGYHNWRRYIGRIGDFFNIGSGCVRGRFDANIYDPCGIA